MKFKYIFLSSAAILFCYFYYSPKIDDKLLKSHLLNNDAKPSQLSIMSYNIRSSNLDNDLQKWENRKPKLLSIIKKYNPDIISTQEGLRGQIFEIGEHLPQFKMFGFLNDPKPDFENLVIFYNDSKLKLIKGDYFWLSETPHVDFSKSWGAMFPRLATYAIFEIIATKTRFIVINCHFDHKSAEARKNSAFMLIRTLNKLIRNEFYQLPILLMGDFNEAPFTEGYNFFINEGFTSILDNCSHKFQVFKCSFHYYYGKIVENFFVRIGLFFGFKYHSGVFPKFDSYHIDWILGRNGNNSKIVNLLFHMPSDDIDSDGVYASDHFPLFGKIEIINQNI